MRIPLLVLLGLVPGWLWCQEPAVFPRGHVFIAASFEQSDALKDWSGSFTLDRGYAGKPAVFTGHTVPRLRGVVPASKIDEAALRLLGEQWKVNLIRWALIITGPPNSPSLEPDAYDRWLEAEIKDLDALLPLCEKYGMLVLIDLHSPPGGSMGPEGYARSDSGLFSDGHCQAKFVEIWERLARRYREARAVWGYDLANEPVEPALEQRLEAMEHGLADWQELAERTAKAIRHIDAKKAIIVEPGEWANPAGLADFRPLDVPGIVYSVHMYVPFPFTHQGTGDAKDKEKEYPYPGAEIWGRVWDKAQLEAALKPAMDFQQRYNVDIFIGEFGAVRWAPKHSAYRYIRDLIDIFEAHHWDWTYYAFRGHWNGMSVEHGEDRNDNRPAAEPTDRQQLLLEWFSHNEREPGFSRSVH